jgi:hypothetical protein
MYGLRESMHEANVLLQVQSRNKNQKEGVTAEISADSEFQAKAAQLLAERESTARNSTSCSCW